MIALVVAALAIVQPTPAGHDCDDPMSQPEMNACAALDFERADAELNRVWQEAIAAARAADAEIDRTYDQRPTSEAKLREAQRAWIVFRDAHCTVVGYEEARGGSMEPMTYDACRTILTEERTAQLRSLPVDE